MTELENTKIECDKICKYFNGQLIGSILISRQINEDLINDIDIAISKNDYFNVQSYLEDLEFKETKHGYKQRGYADTIGSCIFIKKGYLPIHLSVKPEGYKLLSIPEIWAEKIKRYSSSDREQILSLLSLNTARPWEG